MEGVMKIEERKGGDFKRPSVLLPKGDTCLFADRDLCPLFKSKSRTAGAGKPDSCLGWDRNQAIWKFKKHEQCLKMCGS